uniref:Transposase, Ptta/En/Spm, plant n=1 Tax=Chenopodium quinoa TaxID=63459 RepID=A0A803N0U9_CHEQI
MKSFMKNSKIGRGGNQGGVRANNQSVVQDNLVVTRPTPPPSNERVQVNSNIDVTVENDVAPQNLNGVEQGKIELSPDGLWFDDHTVSGNVTKSWKAHYNHPYMNFTEVPLMVRDRWFTKFKRTYTWRPEFDAKAGREFDKKAGDRLRGTLNQVFKIALHKQVSFMIDTVRAEFINKRKHPDFVKRSNQERDNRLSGQTSPLAIAKAKKKDGILPTAAEVYESTHSVFVGNDEVELMGDKSQKVMGEYMEKLEEYKNKGIEINLDKVYLEVVGGQKKGKVYGLGSASHMYYKSDPTSQSTASSSTPSMISQLSSQVEELKKMAEENHNEVEESQKNSGRELKMC